MRGSPRGAMNNTVLCPQRGGGEEASELTVTCAPPRHGSTPSSAPSICQSQYSRLHRGHFLEGPSPAHRLPLSFSVRRRGTGRAAEWISSGMTTAGWHLSLFCFLPPCSILHTSLLFSGAVLPPGAADLGRATHNSHNIRSNVRQCPGGRSHTNNTRGILYFARPVGVYANRAERHLHDELHV